MSDICGMHQFVTGDGLVCYVDSMTRVKKKNRKRHIKDGAPKNMRGINHMEILGRGKGILIDDEA